MSDCPYCGAPVQGEHNCDVNRPLDEDELDSIGLFAEAAQDFQGFLQKIRQVNDRTLTGLIEMVTCTEVEYSERDLEINARMLPHLREEQKRRQGLLN